MINIFSFLPDVITYLFNLFRILINYLCILLCIDDNNEEINEEIKSPTPLLSPNVKKHPILDAYENKILNQIKSEEDKPK